MWVLCSQVRQWCTGSDDLDECNGRFSVTPEYANCIYHYVIMAEFLQIVRCWVGFPDSSFRRKSAPQTGGQPGGGKPGVRQHPGQGGPSKAAPKGGPPPEAFEACKNESDDEK